MANLGKSTHAIIHKFMASFGGRVLLSVAIAFIVCIGKARAETTNDYHLEAVFISNFPQYTDWPKDAFSQPRAPLIIGILGKDPFGDGIDDAVRTKKSFHPIIIQRFHKFDEVKDCQILYISGSETKRLPHILAGLKGRSILTVSDMPGFAPRGGMVSLSVQSNQMQMQVNLAVLNAARLTMSSKLLRAAEIVATTEK